MWPNKQAQDRDGSEAALAKQVTEDTQMLPAILVNKNVACHQVSSHCSRRRQCTLRGIQDAEKQDTGPRE